MKLTSLLKYNDLVIQMHDNPDADAIGSGFAIYSYLKDNNKNVRLVYSGSDKFTKSNIVMMVDALDIPIEYANDIGNPEALITVDCQYGEGNVSHLDAQNIFIIDHHNTGKLSDERSEIRSHIVSCSTICYDMLSDVNYNINENIPVATALYYGMYMDSNGFAELRHPIERDMIDYLKVDTELINKLIHSNFTLSELETAAIAMIRYTYDEANRTAIIKANPCDPNILGIIGDMVLQVDSVDICIVYNECPTGYKLSVRSCIKSVAANDLAEYLTNNIGNGGGHADKAGGFIVMHAYKDHNSTIPIEMYLMSRIKKYADSYSIIYADKHSAQSNEYIKYQKKPYMCGYVKTCDIAPDGTDLKIRTLEGDVFVTCNDSIYLMIDVTGNVYPIEKARFEKSYTTLEETYTARFDYNPTIVDLKNNKPISLLKYARLCQSSACSVIYAKKTDKSIKLFTRWNYEKYMLGNPGDYMCYPVEDPHDFYIVAADIFELIYDKAI